MYTSKSDMDSNIIAVIKKFPSLYDTSCADFKNAQTKQEAWEKISDSTGTPVDVCKKRWRALRERYTREMRRKLANLDMTWPFFDSMMFLDNFIKLRSGTSSTIESGTTTTLAITKTELQIEPNEYEADEDFTFGNDEDYIVVSSEPAADSTPISVASTPTSRPRKRKSEDRSQAFDTADEDTAYADYLAISLRKLPRLLNIRCKTEILKILQKFIELDEMERNE